MGSQLKSVERIEKIMDRSIGLPGGYKIGLDGIIGLIPGVGDVVTAGVSSFLIYKAIQLKVSSFVVLRMALNVLIDTVIGAIPFVGDIFDFFWKANVKNAALLRKHVDNPKSVKRSSAGFVAVSLLIIIVIVALTVTLFVAVIKALLGVFS